VWRQCGPWSNFGNEKTPVEVTMHLYEVLRRPVITEKNSSLLSQNKYTFEVDRRTSKHQIREAVEKAFNVEVMAVNVMTVPGKKRRMRGREVLSPCWKKAVVTLKEGNKIDIFEGV
jgi:large subunit ribosomal protein L23